MARWLRRAGGLGVVVGVSLGLGAAGAWGARLAPVGKAGSQPFGVALSGPSAVWPVAAARHATPVEVRVGSPGRVSRAVFRAEVTPGEAVEPLPVIAAGPRLIAVGLRDFVRTEETVDVVGASAWIGPRGGPLRRLDAVGPSEWPVDLAVDGERIALVVASRTRERARARLIVRDMSAGRERSRRLPRRDVGFVALAGSYVATMRQRGTVDRTEILVHDIRRWRTQTRVVVPEDAIDVTVALRRDGALAIAYGFRRYTAAIVRRGGQLRGLRPRPSSLQIAFGPRGVVYPQRVRRGVRLIEVAAGRPTRHLTAPIRGLVDFDAEGGRLALRTRRCVYVASKRASMPARPCVDRS